MNIFFHLLEPVPRELKELLGFRVLKALKV
jgi:hypothetical protein